MTDVNGPTHVCENCGETHEHDWKNQQKDSDVLFYCLHTTVEDWEEHHKKNRFTRGRDMALNFRAIANLYWDGDIRLALMADIAMSLSGWRNGMDRSVDMQKRIIEMAEADHDKGCGCEDGDKWKDGE